MSDEKMPACPICEGPMQCPDCEDSRPKAQDLSAGWRLRTPFGRWEVVTRVEHDYKFGPVIVTTDQTGPAHPWRYFRHTAVFANPPEIRPLGEPEIRVVENASVMYAFACDGGGVSSLWPGEAAIIVESRSGGRGAGWWVSHRMIAAEDPVVETFDTKAKARTAVRSIARQWAKTLRVKLNLPTDRAGR